MPNLADVPAARKAGVPSPDVEALLAQMTLDEKIGQMTQADKNALKDGKEIARPVPGLGAVGRRFAAQAQRARRPGSTCTTATRARRCRRGSASRCSTASTRSTATAGSRARRSSRTTSAWVATRNPALVEAVARVTAREIAGTGIDWTFAPCIAVARDERWGRTYESFGENTELVATLGAAAIRGFEQPTDGTAVLACAKHFLGDGGTMGARTRATRASPRKI